MSKTKINSAQIREKNTGKRISQKQLTKRIVGPAKQMLRMHLKGFTGSLLFYRTSPYDLVLEQLTPGLRKPTEKPQGEVTRVNNGDTIDLEVIRRIEIS